jgi:large subunit ribosomal protein L20
MVRVKRGNVARKRRKKILNLAKGFRGALSKLYRPAHQAVLHALSYSFRDRRKKKRDFRQLWIARMNAALREQGISYSAFMGKANKQNVKINRKMYAMLAVESPEVFKQTVAHITK